MLTEGITPWQRKALLYSRQSVVPRQRTISGRYLRKTAGSALTYWHWRDSKKVLLSKRTSSGLHGRTMTLETLNLLLLVFKSGRTSTTAFTLEISRTYWDTSSTWTASITTSRCTSQARLTTWGLSKGSTSTTWLRRQASKNLWSTYWTSTLLLSLRTRTVRPENRWSIHCRSLRRQRDRHMKVSTIRIMACL